MEEIVYLVRSVGLFMTLLLVVSVMVPSANAQSDQPTVQTPKTIAPPRRAPHDTAKKLADQLSRSAAAVSSRLSQLPPGQTNSERNVRRHVASFLAESDALRRHMTRFLIDKRPVYASVDRLENLAWSMHKSLGKATKYKSIWSVWARTVSILRRLQKSMPRRH